MRFQVPQFIEVESKIFGPLTLKQFIYLIGGAGIVFILYAALPLWLTIPLALPVAGFSLALAFYKINNQPFIKVAENAVRHYLSARLYLWRKVQLKPALPAGGTGAEKEKVEEPIYVPKLTQSKLKDLAWSLDIKEFKE